MGYIDVFKKEFLELYMGTPINLYQTIVLLGCTCMIALYIFFVYRQVTKKTFYSRTFHISLPAVAVITAAIILAVQSSIIISLGMVGALSIVRFRTAIKEPMDLCFLFWSIAVGICCGAQAIRVSLVLSVILTVLLVVLNRIPIGRAPMLLLIDTDTVKREPPVLEVVKKYSKYVKVKTRNIMDDGCNYIIEINATGEYELVCEIKELEGVERVSLIAHDGEVHY